MRNFCLILAITAFLLVSCQPADGELAEPTSNDETTNPTDLPEPTVEPSPTVSEPQLGVVLDVDGNEYTTLTIGEQTWLGENLRTVTGPTGREIESYCYDDLEENCEIYGRLYDWAAAMAGSRKESSQGICPEGWHMPSLDEWQELFDFLGGTSVAGGKLKAVDYWDSPNTGATDEVGFGALPSGWFDFTGEFWGLGETGFYRSSTSEGSYEIFVREFNSKSASVSGGGLHPDDAIPVRCVKD